MIKLPDVVAAWNSPDFAKVFIAVIQRLRTEDLPLQQALERSSYVSESSRTVILLDSSAEDECIRIKAGVFYTGIIAGSCCSDDPTPLCEETEYCEVLVEIDRQTAIASITLLPE